jgi:hypothetical protein
MTPTTLYRQPESTSRNPWRTRSRDPGMLKHPTLTALFVGALSALATRTPAHLDGDLAELAERLLREIGTPLQA